MLIEKAAGVGATGGHPNDPARATTIHHVATRDVSFRGLREIEYERVGMLRVRLRDLGVSRDLLPPTSCDHTRAMT